MRTYSGAPWALKYLYMTNLRKLCPILSWRENPFMAGTLQDTRITIPVSVTAVTGLGTHGKLDASD